eukprot:tig00021319_g20204.t1
MTERRSWACAALRATLALALLITASAAPGDSIVLTTAITYPRQMAYCPSLDLMMISAGLNTEHIVSYHVATGTVTNRVSWPNAVYHAQGTGSMIDGYGTNVRIYPDSGNLLFDRSCQHLYWGETGTCTVRRLNLATAEVVTIAGTNNQPCTNTEGMGTLASLNGPRGLALSPDGAHLYVSVLHGIRRIDLATGAVAWVAGGSSPGTGAGLMDGPAGIALVDADTLLVAEETARLLRRLAISTGQMSVLAGSYAIASNSYGVGTAATFASVFKVGYWRPLGAAFVTLPVNAPFLRRVVVDSFAGTPGDAQALPFTVSGPFAGATFVADLAFDAARQRAYLTGFTDGSRVYALEMGLPAEIGCAAGASCVAVGPGGSITVGPGGSITVL